MTVPTGLRPKAGRPGRSVRGTLTAGLAVALGFGCGTQDSLPDPSPQQVWSVQLHVHGPFSEGVGSIDSHSSEARALGVDAIWWSDHDFRIASWQHIERFGFESWEEPIDRDESWRARASRAKHGETKGLRRAPREGDRADAELVEAEPREGSRSLRLYAEAAPDAHAAQMVAFRSTRSLHRRPLASGVAIEISILGEELGPDAMAFVDVELSEHPRADGGEPERFALRYACGAQGTRLRGTRLELPLECPAGVWRDHRLELTADALRGFQDFPGDDNALVDLRFGVAARAGARASARFDRLRIDQRLRGEEAFARQRALIAEVGRRHPGVHQLQGVEISAVGRHLNEFSIGTLLLDYGALARSSEREDLGAPIDEEAAFQRLVTRSAVEAAHARGGLISLNHMFGVGFGRGRRRDPGLTLEKLIAERAHGADVLEVGYRHRGGNPLADHLWVWDGLARAGIRLVGIGVSDSHGGPEQRWRTAPNNFVSWIHAPSPSKADLLAGLRAGRVFFGDIVLFDGRVDLATEDGARMGDTVFTAAHTIDVAISIDGLSPGDRIDVVEAFGTTASHVAGDGPFRALHTVELRDDADGLVRLEVYSPDGREKVFSNPIWFVRP